MRFWCLFCAFHDLTWHAINKSTRFQLILKKFRNLTSKRKHLNDSESVVIFQFYSDITVSQTGGVGKIYLTLQIENQKIDPPIDKYRVAYRGIFNFYQQEYYHDFSACESHNWLTFNDYSLISRHNDQWRTRATETRYMWSNWMSITPHKTCWPLRCTPTTRSAGRLGLSIRLILDITYLLFSFDAIDRFWDDGSSSPVESYWHWLTLADIVDNYHHICVSVSAVTVVSCN